VQSGLGDPLRIGTASSFWNVSVKVARHKTWDSFCGGLWKRVGSPSRKPRRRNRVNVLPVLMFPADASEVKSWPTGPVRCE
jgi:hypothetical protein